MQQLTLETPAIVLPNTPTGDTYDLVDYTNNKPSTIIGRGYFDDGGRFVFRLKGSNKGTVGGRYYLSMRASKKLQK